MKLFTNLAPFNKAIVPLFVAGILALLAGVGVTPEMSVKEAVTMLVTAGLVWIVPNLTQKKK